MEDTRLREDMGKAARKRVVELYDYKVVAQKFIELVSKKFGGS